MTTSLLAGGGGTPRHAGSDLSTGPGPVEGSHQAPPAVVVVRPHHFRPNPQTAADNAFQVLTGPGSGSELSARAFGEVTAMVTALRAEGVVVHLFEDERDDRPDSVFCNNWFTTHADGRLVLHAMLAPNRRTERREDVVAELRAGYRVSEVVDLTDGPTLEGTGAMVLDHDARVAYCARSLRADPAALAGFGRRLGYRVHSFSTADGAGRPVYHTNVMMALATELSLVGLDLVPDVGERRRLRRALAARGAVVELTREQVGHFTGNALELATPTGRVLAMSARGVASLTERQREIIEAGCRLLPLDVPTLELAGGSVRCTLAGIHLPPPGDLSDGWQQAAPAAGRSGRR